MEDPPTLRGITFKRAAPTVLGGQAYMRWRACDEVLEWSDARWPTGQPPYEPVPVPIEESGRYTLTAHAPNGEEIWAEFEVTKEFMPLCGQADEVTAFPLITVSDRRCYDVRISNIKLMETEPSNGGASRGINNVLVFFTQAPETRLTSPGISKLAELTVQFRCEDPRIPSTCIREPADGSVLLTDDMFVTASP
jgi:hypothetical protein